MNRMHKISFTLNALTDSEDSYSILLKDNGEIDYLGTILQIGVDLSDFYFEIEESYNSGTSYDGLEILLRIRLSYFYNPEIALAPIVVALSSPINKILKNYPRYSILFSDGITIRNQGDHRITETPPRLREETLLHILSSIPIEPDKHKNRHSLANEWGPLRLKLGFLLLSNNRPNFNNLLLQSKLAENPYYWSLLSLEALTHKVTIITQSGKPFKNWEKFLLKSNNLNILIIDDELDKGWGEAFDLIFNTNTSEVKINYITPRQDDNIEGIKGKLEELLRSTDFDLVICDLRLLPQDQSHGVAEDQHRVSELTGAKLISEIKEFNPTIPVLALTASNKAWTFRILEHDLGVDGYWIKESPESGASQDFSKNNTEVLLQTIQNLILHKRSYKFIWELIMEVRATLSDTNKVNDFVVNLSNARETQQAEVRLKAIENLLLRAYAVIYRNPMPFLERNFGFSPFEQSFIYLWGCLTELAWLRVKLYRDKDCFLQFSDKRKVIFTKFDADLVGSFKQNKFNLFNKNIVPKEFLNLKNVPNPWLVFTKPTDTWFISLILYQLDDKSYYNEFKNLREKRNNIDFIHGDSVTVSNKNLSIMPDDLAKLAQLINVLLSV
jgi:CheY-like chemotaxis protein